MTVISTPNLAGLLVAYVFGLKVCRNVARSINCYVLQGCSAVIAWQPCVFGARFRPNAPEFQG